MSNHTTVEIERSIERLQAGDKSARGQLLNCACERLRQLTDRMMRQFSALHRFEQSEDVLQNSLMRLNRSLEHLSPRSAREFFGLAALEIRRELIDLTRHYYGPLGHGTKALQLPADDSRFPPNPAYEAPDSSNDPVKLAVWAEFHQHVDSLPNEDREMFDLLWYQELSQADAAEVLEVSVRTVKRRWQHARLAVHARIAHQLR